jgi:flagellar basal-body rod protein FlgB
MVEKPEIMRLAQKLVGHASMRHAEIARNVANADTPGYRAKDVVPFKEYLDQSGTSQMRTTRPGHIGMSASPDPSHTIIDARTEPAPNGNSVSLETELIKQAETRHQHDMALSVYKHSLDLLRTSLGRSR